MPKPTSLDALAIMQKAGFQLLSYLDLADLPTLGSAAARNVPATPATAAGSAEVVLGDDPRLAGLSGVANLPPYVYLGAYSGIPAPSGYANGSRATVSGLAANGALAELEVRTIGATKWWMPLGEITLASGSGAITGTSGTASTLATPLVGPLTGAAAGVFLTLSNLLPAGLLSAPGQTLRVYAVGKKVGTGGSVAYSAVLDSVQFAAAVSGGGTGQDVRLVAELITTAGLAYGSGTAPLNGSASQQAVPVSLNNAAAQSITIGWTAGNAADSQNLYAYRITLSA